ncbi:MAG: hypothetical protein ACI4XL_04410 [Bacillus sp. (in: firmicutes)]
MKKLVIILLMLYAFRNRYAIMDAVYKNSSIRPLLLLRDIGMQIRGL